MTTAGAVTRARAVAIPVTETLPWVSALHDGRVGRTGPRALALPVAV